LITLTIDAFFAALRQELPPRATLRFAARPLFFAKAYDTFDAPLSLHADATFIAFADAFATPR